MEMKKAQKRNVLSDLREKQSLYRFMVLLAPQGLIGYAIVVFALNNGATLGPLSIEKINAILPYLSIGCVAILAGGLFFGSANAKKIKVLETTLNQD